MNGKQREYLGHFPDGLDEHAIDGLIAEVSQEAVEVPAATSGLLDGTAAERRRRRIERRALAAVVRSLPMRRAVAASEAA